MLASVVALANGRGRRGPQFTERGSAKARYAAVRRYEGVTDPQKVGQLVEEGFLPIISAKYSARQKINGSGSLDDTYSVNVE